VIALAFATFFSSTFGLLVRHAQRQEANLWAVTAINYLTASCFHAIRYLLSASAALPSVPTLTVGILGGIAFVTAFFMLSALMAHRGVSIAMAVLRLGVVIPMLVGVLFWGESPGALQAAGALLALLALPLLTITPQSPSVGRPSPSEGGAVTPVARTNDASSHRDRRRQRRLLFALFVGNGLCMLAMRAFRQVGTEGESSLFLATLFGTAAAVGLGAWIGHWSGTSRRDVLPGMAVGLCNAIANLALVAALRQLPGVLVFPFYSAVGVVLSALFAGLVWGERIRRLELAGMGVAVAAVVLINLG
jgi:drug/metabolite transporter (DMT)-like permease